ncbi:site-specific integrase [uncultured Shimia sp.]|uniref:site-specific integrase n=1 Tax=uncultured Shimia sp. TaxID=573152 RepID=UPI00260CD1AE|nr:site-specific integrase [uncultured Shimia sp.]
MATINKRPSGKWQATVRYQGRSASKSFTKRADAVKWSRLTEMQAESGVLIQRRGGTPDKRTLALALAKFRDTVAPTHRSGDREQRCIDAMLKHHQNFTRLRLDSLTVADVSKWRDERLQKVAASTVVRELTLLQSAVGYALDAGAANVVRQVKRPRVDDRRERRLQADEWQRLMQACDGDRNKLLRPLLVLAVETAMRRGELLAMEWRHVDLQRSTVLLPRTKNGYARTVPLSPTAVQIFSELPRTDGRVLPLSGDCVRQGFERLRTRAGVEDLRFHDLRHEAISRLVERGLSLIEVQQVSGHRTLQMLQRYVHLQTDDIVAKLHMRAVS